MRNIIVVLMVFVICSTGFAAENQPKKKVIKKTVVTTVEEVDESTPVITPKEEKNPTVVKEEFVLEDSSAHNRMDKKYIAWWQVVGLGPYVVNTSGLAFGYYLNRNDIIFAQATGGSDDDDLDTDNYGYDIDVESYGMHWKRFNGNSFYFTLGLDFRKINYVYSNDYTPTYSRFKATTTNVSFAIGNQWQWKNFTLGCDWVGASYPLFNDISNSYINDNSDYAGERFKDDKYDYTERTAFRLLGFYLGASF